MDPGVEVYHADESKRKPDFTTQRFEKDWKSFSERINLRLLHLSDEVCENIAAFIHKTYKDDQNASSNPFTGLIHTALMLASVNTPDHTAMYENLKRLITERGGHVAIIPPGSNFSTSSHIFASIFKQLTEDGGSSQKPIVEKVPKSLRMSLAGVSAWYYGEEPLTLDSKLSCRLRGLSLNEKKSQVSTPNKAASRKTPQHTKAPVSKKTPASQVGRRGPLVVVIPSMERVPAPVLRDFLLTTALHVTKSTHRLPIHLVLGLSSSEDLGLEAQLDAKTLSCLSVKRFKVPPPLAYVNVAFNELFYVPGFRASRQIIRFLIHHVYNCFDFSVANLLQRYKLAMLSHYQSLDHPAFLSPLVKSNAYLMGLSDDAVSRLLSTYPSLACLELREDKENCPNTTWTSAAVTQFSLQAQGESSLKGEVRDALLVHWLVQLILPIVFEWLTVLMRDVVGAGDSGNMVSLYCDWVAGRLLDPDHVRRFSVLDPPRIIASLEASEGSLETSIALLNGGDGGYCKRVWFDLSDKHWEPCIEPATLLLTELKNSLAEWRERLGKAAAVSAVDDKTPPKETALAVTPKLQKRMTMQELKQQLLPSKPDTPKPASDTNSWRQTLGEFTQWLGRVLSPTGDNRHALLPSPAHLPFHEVFYGAAGLELKRRMDPQLAGTLNRCLAHVEEFMTERNWDAVTMKALSGRAPDICVVYKLYKESGSLMCLRDMLESFATMVEPDAKEVSQIIQARFLRAMADLEHMGFLRYTDRKSDHAMKTPLADLISRIDV